MYAVGRIGSYISRGVDTVAAPFHPFGGAVDMIVVRQADGSLKSSPWYVRFGKFQGMLKTREKVVSINVNGVEADFHMYLDHKGEAYFLHEVNVDEEEIVLYRSSSDEDTDKQASSKRLTKSESFATQVKQPNSARQADGRDECRRERDAWSDSRRARILGLVFGSRSFKERMSQQSPQDEEMKRARLLERAEIAADLLELKWSTTLATKKPKRNNSSRDPMTTETINDVVMDKDQTPVSPVTDSENGELIHDTVRMDLGDSCICTETNGGTIEQTSDVKSPMKYSVFLAQESSDSLEIPGTEENVRNINNELCNGEADRSNVILDANSLIGIQLVTDDSVDTEISEVIHPTNVVISRTEENYNTNMVLSEASGTFSRQSSSCSSCISEEEVVRPNVLDTVDQSCSHTSDIDSHYSENSAESSHDNAVYQPRIDNIINPIQSTSSQMHSISSDDDQFCFSNLVDSKLMELHRVDSTLPHSKSDATGGDNESPKKGDDCNIYESFSSSDNVDQPKLTNILEEHFKNPAANETPNEMPFTQKSDDLSKSGKNASTEEVGVVSPEPVDVPDKPWGIWPFTFKRSRSMKSSKPVTRSPRKALSCSYVDGTVKQDTDDSKPKLKVTQKKIKTVIPTAEQLASLNLKEGRNDVTFTFYTAMLGDQRVDARIYVWKWNAKIVISDVDGTITRSDVLGQVMPLVGMDWSHIGVTQLFSAIKENGYQMLFLSARAISQAYHTRQFLFNLKQNGQPLPDGPVVISPDGLFPSLFREVIRRAPHEFKIACLEDIKSCFPSDCNPFYAGFGNRDTDAFSYLKVGIPEGKIFIINPKGEVAVHRRLDTKSYTSLHSLVNGIFPPTSTTEQEDFNSWNFWKLPPPTL